MKNFITHPFSVIIIAAVVLTLAYLVNAQIRETGTILPPDKNAARFTTEASPLDKVMELQHQASDFPNSSASDETIGTFYVWSANMGESGLNIVTAAPRLIEDDELLYRTPNEFWKKDGQLGPHNEELLHNEVEAVLLAPGITPTKGTALVVHRHELGFLYGTPISEEEVFALN